MGKLLKTEFRKLLQQKSLYICLGIVVLLIAVSIMLFASEDTQDVQGLGSYLLLSAFSGSGTDILLPILVALLVCGDFKSGSVKLIVARGYSRTAVYCSKFIMVFVITLILGVVSWCAALIFISAFLHCTVTLTLRILLILILQIHVMFIIGVITFFIAILARKSSVAIAGGLVVPIVGTILISLIDSLHGNRNFSLNNYWIFTFLEELSNQAVATDVMLRCVLVSFVCDVILFGVGLKIFSKSDV